MMVSAVNKAMDTAPAMDTITMGTVTALAMATATDTTTMATITIMGGITDVATRMVVVAGMAAIGHTITVSI